ncbi:MAG: hypothetical protein IPI87_18010 [Betaproteobacteria bacterium]|nr:hypothetical protein [Betaproteobacteria bacterium]
MKMEMPGMPMAMPAQTSQVCLKKNRKTEDTIPSRTTAASPTRRPSATR